MKLEETHLAAAWEYHGEDIGVPIEDVEYIVTEAITPGDSGFAEQEVVGIYRLRDDRYLYVSGGCDTTGWNCRSHAVGIVMDKLENLIRDHVTDDDRQRLNMVAVERELDRNEI